MPLNARAPFASQAARLLLLCPALCAFAGCAPPGSPFPIAPVRIVDQYPTWSPTDSLVAFHRGIPSSYGPPGVYLANVNGSLPATSPRLLYDDEDGAMTELQFSPDGSKIAGIVHGQLVLLDTATGQLTTLGYTHNRASSPDWSPDGTRLVYARIWGEQAESIDSVGLHIFDLRTGTDARIAPGSSASGLDPSWSPADSLIAFVGGPVFVIRRDGQGFRQLTRASDGEHDISPTWIDGGARVLFLHTGTRDVSTGYVDLHGSRGQWPWCMGGMYAVSRGSQRVAFAGTVQRKGGYDVVLFLRNLRDMTGASQRRLTIAEVPVAAGPARAISAARRPTAPGL